MGTFIVLFTKRAFVVLFTKGAFIVLLTKGAFIVLFTMRGFIIIFNNSYVSKRCVPRTSTFLKSHMVYIVALAIIIYRFSKGAQLPEHQLDIKLISIIHKIITKLRFYFRISKFE